MSSNFACQNLRGVGRGMPASVGGGGGPVAMEGWNEAVTGGQPSMLPHHLASTDRPQQRLTVPAPLSRTPVKQSVPKSYVGVSTDEEMDFEDHTSADERRERRESSFGMRAISPVPAPPFQRNSKAYRSFGGFGSKAVSRPPRGIMRSPKAPAAPQQVRKTAANEEVHPAAPIPRSRYHSGDRPQSVASVRSPPKKQADPSLFAKIRQGLDFGASFSSRRSSSNRQPESLMRGPPPAVMPIGSFQKLSLPISERPRIVGGFGRGFPARPI